MTAFSRYLSAFGYQYAFLIQAWERVLFKLLIPITLDLLVLVVAAQFLLSNTPSHHRMSRTKRRPARITPPHIA